MFRFSCRFSVFAIAAVLGLAEVGLGQSVPNFRFPTVTAEEISGLGCYMQTADGRVLNLHQLCEDSSRPQVVFGEVHAIDNFMLGQVINRTEKRVQNVRVNYEVRNQNNRVIARSSTPVNPTTLNPGQIAGFETVAQSGTIRATSIAWNE